VLLLTLVLAGCAGTSGSAQPDSAHTDQASTTQVDPCGLLNSAQLRQLRFSPGTRQQATDTLGGQTCVWRGYPIASGPTYTARVLRGPAPAGTPSAAIDNLPTAQYQPAGLDQRTHCGFLITVASNQTLAVQFADEHGSTRGMSHQVACTKAQAAAADMVSSYRSVAR
jgi:hypothetical protein